MKKNLKIALLGDIIGRPGRHAVRDLLPELIKKEDLDFVIANGENLSGGKGIIHKNYKEIRKAGVDVVTSGNHIWNKKEVFDFISKDKRILRPANYPEGTPGRGFSVTKLKNENFKIGVINLLGRTFMTPLDCPFMVAANAVEKIKNKADIIVVDFHAEATAEKEAMGFFLSDRVQLTAGTHTHIQTSDEKIFPGGMAYITDLGRCGAFFSVLGMKPDPCVDGFLTMRRQRFVPYGNSTCIEGVVAEIDPLEKRTENIKRFRFFKKQQ